MQGAFGSGPGWLAPILHSDRIWTARRGNSPLAARAARVGLPRNHEPPTTAVPKLETPPPRTTEAAPSHCFLRLKQRGLSALENEAVFNMAVISIGALPVVLLAVVLFAS
ncbi:hypothetical protein V1289_003557 [Bradyrhizobium sp. AZCC 2289]